MKLRALALGLLVSTPAVAADLVEQSYEPAPVVAGAYDWSGFYVGGQLGGAVAGDRDVIDVDIDGDGDGDFNDLDDADLFLIDEVDRDGENGVIGGVHIGYDHQIDSLVLGAVADVSYLDGSFDSELFVEDEFVFGIYQTVDYVGSVRARVGYAFDRALVYGTGGLAFAGIDSDFASIIDLDLVPGATVSDSDDDTLFGYAVGGGLDYAVTDQITIGGQYLYTRFEDAGSTVTYSLPGTADLSGRSDDTIDLHRIEAKVSYRFN